MRENYNTCSSSHGRGRGPARVRQSPAWRSAGRRRSQGCRPSPWRPASSSGTPFASRTGPRDPARDDAAGVAARAVGVSRREGRAGEGVTRRLPRDRLLGAAQPHAPHRGGGSRRRALPRCSGTFDSHRQNGEPGAGAARCGLGRPVSCARSDDAARSAECARLCVAEPSETRRWARAAVRPVFLRAVVRWLAAAPRAGAVVSRLLRRCGGTVEISPRAARGRPAARCRCPWPSWAWARATPRARHLTRAPAAGASTIPPPPPAAPRPGTAGPRVRTPPPAARRSGGRSASCGPGARLRAGRRD
jgi:hypothetical protein